MSDYENASRAILLAERMDAKNKKLTDNRLLDSVKNKLDILNALE